MLKNKIKKELVEEEVIKDIQNQIKKGLKDNNKKKVFPVKCDKLFKLCGIEPWYKLPNDKPKFKDVLDIGINFYSKTLNEKINVFKYGYYWLFIPKKYMEEPVQTDDTFSFVKKFEAGVAKSDEIRKFFEESGGYGIKNRYGKEVYQEFTNSVNKLINLYEKYIYKHHLKNIKDFDENINKTR